MTKEKTREAVKRLAEKTKARPAKVAGREKLTPVEGAAYDAARRNDARDLLDAVVALEHAADAARKEREAIRDSKDADPATARAYLAHRSSAPRGTPYERARRFLELAHRKKENQV